MDVITCSISGVALTNAASDPTATAFENAAKGGAIVLVAAGNSGEDAANYPSFNTIGSPSNAPDVISVGATENSHVMLPAVTLKGSNVPSSLQGIPAMPSDSFNYPSTTGANTATLVDVTTAGDSTGLLCNALTGTPLYGAIVLMMIAVVGFIVLVERGTCTFAAKATNAQNAGAVGMIIYWADATAVSYISGVGQNNSTDANFVGPVVAISNAAGTALKSYIDANPGLTVSVASGGTEADITTWSNAWRASLRSARRRTAR